MKRRSVSSERSSIRWPSLAVPRVSRDMICVCPRVKRPDPCTRGATPTSHSIGRISSGLRPSGRFFSTAILRRTSSLYFASAAFLTKFFVSESFAVAGPHGRPDREGQLDGLDDVVEQELSLRRLQLLRVLLGVGQRPQVGLELRPHRLQYELETGSLEHGREAHLPLDLPEHVLLGRV